MNLSEWLHYIGSIHRTEIDLGLARIAKVADLLGIDRFNCPIVSVAGTNGKGSCVATIDSIVRQAGYQVASYTSPHLCDFNERIQINGKPVADELICQAFAQIEALRDNISLTFFEFVTLAALWIFQQHQLDLIVLEVGLGGRLDAVNIVDADIAVITSIALDHTDRLGDNREAIGKEKAGIFRQGKKAICGDKDIPQSIRQCAADLSLELASLGKDFCYRVSGSTWHWQNAKISYKHLPIPSLKLQNVATALQAIASLTEVLAISEQTISAALAKLSLPGRFYRWMDDKRIILDVAHNPAGGQWLAKQLQQQARTGRLFAVVGMLADKDQPGTLAPLIPLIDKWFVADLTIPRGGSAALLQEHLVHLGAQQLSTYTSVISAYQQATQQATAKDTMIVFGSFHTVGEVLSLLRGQG